MVVAEGFQFVPRFSAQLICKSLMNSGVVSSDSERILHSEKNNWKNRSFIDTTMTNYNYVRNLLTKEEFSGRRIGEVKTSDAKLFLIKLQKDEKGHTTIKTVRGVLKPAFRMAVDDDVLTKNPFGFALWVMPYSRFQRS